MQPIDGENSEEQRKRRIAIRLEQDDRRYEQSRPQRARLIGHSEARLMEVRRQAEEERAQYMHQVQMREAEILRLHRVLQQAERNASASQNAARVSAEELAPVQSMNVGSVTRAAMPPPMLVGPHRLPPNASPRRPTELPQPVDLVGEGPGYDRMEDLMREQLDCVGCTPPMQ